MFTFCARLKSRDRLFNIPGRNNRNFTPFPNQWIGRTMKKQRFHGNQHSKKLDHNKKEVPISHKKLTGVRKLSSKKNVEGFRLLDMVILDGFITTFACPDCLECTLTVNENFTKTKGLSSFLSIECSNCQFSKGSYSSQTLTNDKENGMKPCEINYRAVYALRSVGVGYSGFERLCGFLNLPRPMTQKNYDDISDVLGDNEKHRVCRA